jgi:ribose/xylose/arabinose/galactoside ABC-type transport system permease subunit
MNGSIGAIGRQLNFGNLGLVAFVALLIVSFALASPHFLTFGNITNMLLTVSVIGVMAAVSTLVIVGRELDLSVGSVTALIGVVVAIVVESMGWAWPVGLAVGLLVGALAGAFNGFMVVSLRVNSIITTMEHSHSFAHRFHRPTGRPRWSRTNRCSPLALGGY